EHAARLEAVQDLEQLLRLQLVAAPGAVADMVRELHGVQREHVEAQSLQRQHGGAVADVAVGDLGLDRENRSAPLYHHARWRRARSVRAAATRSMIAAASIW